MTRIEKRAAVQEVQPIDLRDIFVRIKSGDEAAIETFFTYARGKARKVVGTGLPNADIIADTVATKATIGLANFEPPDNPEEFDRAMNGWIVTIARNQRASVFRELRRATPEVAMSESVQRSATEDGEPNQPRASAQDVHEVLQQMLKEKAAELLADKPGILAVVELALAGKSHAEIARDLGISEGNVRQRLSRGRRPLVENIIKPAGFKHSAIFGNYIQPVLSQGRIDSLKFLGMYYLTDETVRVYSETRSVKVNPDLLAQGYVLLYTNASPQTYSWLRFSHLDSPQRALLHHEQGRYYIKPADLAYWEGHRMRAKPSRLRPPEAGLERLAQIANTAQERQILLDACKSDKLAHKMTGRIPWVNRFEAEIYLQDWRLRHSGSIYP